MVPFFAGPAIWELSGILKPYWHWSKTTFWAPVFSDTRNNGGIFQTYDVWGFSIVKKLPCACNNSQRYKVIKRSSFPWFSRSKLPSPWGLSVVRVPLFIFWRRLNELQGSPKCQICFGFLASLQSLTKVESHSRSWVGDGFPLWMSSTAGRILNRLLSLNTWVSLPFPAKISLKLHNASAGCRGSIVRSSQGIESKPSSVLLKFFRLDFLTCNSGTFLPKALSTTGSSGTGSGIFLPLDGWSLGLLFDATHTRCKDFSPATAQPSMLRSTLFICLLDDLPLLNAPTTTLESTSRTALIGSRKVLTRSNNSAFTILSSRILICCLWPNLHIWVVFQTWASINCSSSSGGLDMHEGGTRLPPVQSRRTDSPTCSL